MKFFSAAAALLAALPLVARATLTITTPANWNASGLVTLTWTGDATDPTFSVELLNGGLLTFGALALLNNVSPTAGSASFSLGSVPVGSGYTIEFVNITNINQAYATSSPFAIGATYVATTSVSAAVSTSGTPAVVTVSAVATTTVNAQASSSSAAAAAASATPFHSNGATVISPKVGALGGVLAVGFAMALL